MEILEAKIISNRACSKQKQKQKKKIQLNTCNLNPQRDSKIVRITRVFEL